MIKSYKIDKCSKNIKNMPFPKCTYDLKTLKKCPKNYNVGKNVSQ